MRVDAESLKLPSYIRCYNGCYDSATQRVLDRQAAALAEIQKYEPGAHVTYFGVGPCDTDENEVFMVHVYGRPLSGYHKTRGDALIDALTRLENEHANR